MKTRFCVCLATLFVLGCLSPWPLSLTANAADFSEKTLSGNISSDGTAYVTLLSADPELLYALLDTEPGLDALPECDWRAPENGVVTWDSLTPGQVYHLLYRPAGSDVQPEQFDFLAPAPLPSANALLREPDSEPLFDRLTLSASSPDCEYALVGPGQLTATAEELDWQSGGDTPIVYEHLTFDQEYTLLVRSFSLSPGTPCLTSSALIPVLPDVVLSPRLSASVDAQGYGCITVADGDPDMQYAALAPDGTVAALLDGSCTPLALSGLLPGHEYLITARALSESLATGDLLPARGTAISVPALHGSSSLTTGFCEASDTLFVQLNPACPTASYAILGDDGQPVHGIRAFDHNGAEISGTTGWFCSPGFLRFEALLPGAAYSLALRDENGVLTILCDFTLPQNLPSLQKSEVTLTADSLSFTGQAGIQYALTSADGLSLAADWQNGRDQTLTFDHLVAGQTYQLLLRTEDTLPVFCFSFTPSTEDPTPQPVPPGQSSALGGGISGPSDTEKVDDIMPAPTKAPHAAGAERLLVIDRRIAYIIGEPDGCCRPDEPLTRAEMCMLFYRLLREAPNIPASNYLDVAENAWYFSPVSALTALGIVQGVGEGRFQPDAFVTRAEFSAMAARFCLPADAVFDFSDLPSGHWAYAFACTACANGWLYPDENGAFYPEQPLLRGEAIHALNMILGRSPEPEALEEQSTPPAFSDLSSESPWYYDVWEATLADSGPSSD